MSTHESVHQQIATIKRIIRKDATGRRALCDAEGRMCAIGGLAYYGAQITKPQLRGCTNQYFEAVNVYDVLRIRFPVLAHLRASVIVQVNDAHENLSTRRRALCALFDQLEATLRAKGIA